MKIAGLMLVKSYSSRLPGKNIKDFNGRPMFTWNLEKSLDVLDEVYVSSDSRQIMERARIEGAKTIHRGEELCGDCPDIPVFQHALSKMPDDVEAIIAIHADTPLIEKNLIVIAKRMLEMGVQEIMTCHQMTYKDKYKKNHNKVKGSIRAMTRDRLLNYPDPYKPNPDILLVDTSIEIETQEDYDKALCL